MVGFFGRLSDRLRERFGKVNDKLSSIHLKITKTFALFDPVMNFVMHFQHLAIFVVGAFLIIQCNMTDKITMFSNMVVFSSYGIQVIISFLMLTFIFMIFPRAKVSANRINEVLDEEVSIKDGNFAGDVSEVGTVEFDNVSFKYKAEAENYALYDISLKIKSGSTVGIIGGTGSSKTTLVNLISRLYDPTVGEIYVGDVNIKDYDIETLRNNVAVVLQKNVLFSGSILENLRWGNKEATLEECIEAAKLAQAHDFISSFPDGYDTHIEQGGTNVSGGQKQRLAIARTLTKDTKVILFDEATSALDNNVEPIIGPITPGINT